MTRRYYSSTNQPRPIDLQGLYWKLQHLYLFFRDKDYFKRRAGIDRTTIPDQIKHKAALAISFQPFPITTWKQDEITEENVFDVIEFLDDHISKPGERVGMTENTCYDT